ncbi:LOW QUALITY PROTEIN: hypothetical protein Cgig2_000054 [Carnegiea gigantea]|uniref:Uncharacterized protein n=1 Tax=Carnegiea gigantea TaxID=171969 RepID=A0A9Q1KYY5_9CARY|nr:LOW QUALITY PROTEIN: hypothetical protein Cgig2_000054 [Carnegiea gigantea]
MVAKRWLRSRLSEVHGTGIKLKVMVASRKKSANWTNRDDEKLSDILIERSAQGSVKFEWRINKDGAQIKNRYNDLGKKLRAWEFLIGKTGVGVDYKTGAVHTTGEMSFALGMLASPSNQTQQSKGKAIDMDEHVIVTKRIRMVSMLILNALVQGKVALLLKVYTALASEKVKAGLLVTAKGKNFLIGCAPSPCYSPHEGGIEVATIAYQTGVGTTEGTPPNFCHEIGFYMECDGLHQKKREEKFFLDLDDEFVILDIKRVLDLTMHADCSIMDEADYRMDKDDCTMDDEEGHAIDTIIGYTL